MAFRDGPFENLKVPLAWTAAVATVVAIIGSVFLLLNHGRDDGVDDDRAIRAGFETGVAPVSGALAAPVGWGGNLVGYVRGYFTAVSDNRRLRREVAELQAWRDEAIALKNINHRYEALMGLRTEPPVPMVAARSISESRGPFANSRLLDAGSSKGVSVGNPVVDEHGMVGRIIGVSGGVSRMLMLTDVASKLPIIVERTDARAVLSGDGSGNPRLEYLRGENAIQAGDRILTSGDGGGVPRGLAIGVAAKGLDGAWRVKMFNERGAVDYVRILLFDNFGQLADPNVLNAPPLAGLGTAPAPTAALTATINDVAARRDAAAAAAVERARQANLEAERQAAARAAAAREAQTNATPANASPAAAPATAAPTTGGGAG